MAARKKQKSAELIGQSDPRAPLDSGAFLAEARPVLAKLTDDLLARADASPAVTRALEARHAAEQAAQRTAESFATWRRSFVDQVAAAWLLSCVFVRTLEDRGLVGHARLAGPGAADSQRLFLELAPSLTERDYLLATFRELCHLPAAKELFEPKHNPVWLLAPSADAAKSLLQLFRAPHADKPAFRFGQADTRFLGDLYQDLNDDVKKRYALFQTPRFVERFILDRTLERAIERFGLDDTTVIDPTCGSGHFLLGAFERLFDHRLRAEPGLDVREAARRALDQVYGADINPYAVAIARFRLTLAFLERAGYTTLDQAPAVPLHLVVADSLLHNPELAQLELGDRATTSVAAWKGEEFALEDEAAARDVLHRRYAAVVGNPPFVGVPDPKLRDRYRAIYVSASGKYTLSAPFVERFFQLARSRGFVGLLNSNAFMKRAFGKALVETYLPSVDLDLIVNTAWVPIPGPATQTVMLFGSGAAAIGDDVRVVLAIRGETERAIDGERSAVWGSMVNHWDTDGYEDEFISVARIPRALLAKHPWSLGGGGASELKELLEDGAECRLGEMAESIGISCVTGEDEVFLLPADTARRLQVGQTAPLVTGEFIRDWTLSPAGECIFPYDDGMRVRPLPHASKELKFLWTYRSVLSRRKRFGVPMLERGLTWYELQELYVDKLRSSRSIAYAEVASQNHFLFENGRQIFKQTAPLIKLRDSASDEDHLALVAYLNSSTACFWMKQVCHQFGTSSHDLNVDGGKPEDNRFSFAAGAISRAPIPRMTPDQQRRLAALAARIQTLAAKADLARCVDAWVSAASSARSVAPLDEVEKDRAAARDEIVALQEEIDWLVYSLFGLAEYVPLPDRPIRVSAALRPFEQPPPNRLPDVWAERACRLRESRQLGLIETREFKRAWRGRRGIFGHAATTFDRELERAWRGVALIAAEQFLSGETVARSRPEIISAVEHDTRIQNLICHLDMRDATGLDLNASAFPFLSTLGLTESGQLVRAQWERVWQLQRHVDAGEPVGEIPEPPKYAQRDFRLPSYWRLRGKLDVPKERFISYPGCESDEDGEPVYGWAGWDHAQRARALGSLFYKRKSEEGWKKDRLTPMLAGLLELLPWLHQWHAEPDEEYGGQSPARYFQDFLDAQCAELGLTPDELNSWRPAEKKRKTGRRAKVEPQEQAE